jgi:hypothetical protein
MLSQSSVDQARRAVEEARWEIKFHEIRLSEAIAKNRVDAVNRHSELISIWQGRLIEREALFTETLKANLLSGGVR